MSTETSEGSWEFWYEPELRPRLGVSGCLLGSLVRHDGGHCRERRVTDVFSQWMELVEVCPEAELGLGTPRPSMRLVGEEQRLLVPSTGQDLTAAMDALSRERIEALRASRLEGFVLKKGSPSCGMERVKIYSEGGMPSKRGAGRFAAHLLESWPELAVEEEGRLNDPHLLHWFVDRVFASNRLNVLEHRGVTRDALVRFHTAHKLLLLAHDELLYRRMGQVVSFQDGKTDREAFAEYRTLFRAALQRKTTRRRHTNVLQHARGHLKSLLPSAAKRELDEAIEDYRLGLLPLAVPLRLVRAAAVGENVKYLLSQIYFDAHPKQLMLLGSV